MKKLYTVTVEFEYAVLAENEREAKWSASDALRDVIIEDYASATETVYMPMGNVKVPQVRRPDDYDDTSLVYGADEDTTLADAIEAEKQRLLGEKSASDFAEKQGNLFEGKK